MHPQSYKPIVGGLDNIVVGSAPDLHDTHRYKPSVLHHYRIAGNFWKKKLSESEL